MDEKELKKLITTPYEDIQEQQERAEQKIEMEVLLFWMFVIGVPVCAILLAISYILEIRGV